MVEVMDQLGSYLTQFARLEEGSKQSWIHPLRQSAMQRFADRGFPTTRDEEWRFTNVAPLLEIAFEPAGPATVSSETVARFGLGEWKRSEVVFVNGRFAPEHSSLSGLPNGVLVGSLKEALETNRELVEPYLVDRSGYLENAFAALNTAFLADGAFVFLRKGSVIEEPIHLLFLSTSSSAPGQASVTHPRNLIVAGPGSHARILESYGGVDGEVYFTNAVTEVVAQESAVVDHYKLQRESLRAFHIATLQYQQERSASISSHSISLGGGLVRNDINVVLDGEGGDLTLNGLYVGNGEQHVDHHTVIDHAKPHCTSRELYKGILNERSQAVFNGRIIVRPDAQKTDAQQTNKNLLLSDDALVNTNPQLEINADDVKCAHGATIGQLDADVLFYLRSRGIDLETARHLLTQGFISDISDRIKIDVVRTELERVLFSNLPTLETRDS
jgi:Fe-S cluster assembly protein SufD